MLPENVTQSHYGGEPILDNYSKFRKKLEREKKKDWREIMREYNQNCT